MRAKLSVGDTWFKEGGSAALTQAEAEYEDFITFFPNAPEAAEAKMKVADIYYQQMEKPDADFTNAQEAEKEYREMINMFPDSTLIPRAKQSCVTCRRFWANANTRWAPTMRAAKIFVAAIRPPSDGGRYLSALLQERPGAARHRRRLRRPGAHRADRPRLPARSASACTPCMKTRRPRPTKR